MSHELEIKKDGTASMFYVKAGGTPWHQLGTALDNPPTAAAAIKAAGLDWPVSVHPMETWIDVGETEPICLAAQSRMVVRKIDNKYQRLSEVGPDWHPLQNIEAFDWFNPFIESGECSFETAGSLFGGERIWVLAKLNREPLRIVGDDIVNKYLMLSNNHSAKRSARISLSPIRVVCANTLAATFQNSATKFFSIRHTSKIKDNLDALREVINTANSEFEATAEQYKALTKLQVNQDLLKKYIKFVFKAEKKDKDEETTEEASIEAQEVVDEGKRKYSMREDDSRLVENKIIPLFEGGRGSQLPGVRGTMWAAYNAVTEYLNWQSGRTNDARLDSLWFGKNSGISRKALDVALDLVKKAA